MKLFYYGLLLLWPYLGRAQEPLHPVLSGLSIGDRVPDIVFTKMLNYPTTSLALKDVQATLTILDFWATWCSACLTKFDLLDSVRAAYKGEVEIILVNSEGTRDDEARIAKLLARLLIKRGKPLQLPIAVGDVMAKNYFPHRTIPHYAWLDKNRKLLALSDGEAITVANIERALNGLPPTAAHKIDQLDFDIAQPFFFRDSSMIQQVLLGSNLLQKMNGVPSSSWMERRKDGLISQRRYTNNKVLELLMNAHSKVVAFNQLVFDAALPGDSVYCYELMTAALSMQQSNELMQQDIERYFKVRAKMEVRHRDVYLLTVDTLLLANHTSKGGKKINALNDEGSRYMINKPLQTLTDFLNRSMDKPVIGEAAFGGLLDIDLSTENFSFQNLQLLLAPMGICLQPTQRQMDCFVIY